MNRNMEIENIASHHSGNTDTIIDLENEIPATAIVDIKQNEVITSKNLASVKINIEEPLVEHNNLQNSIEYKLETNDVKYVCRICLLSDNDMFSLTSKIGTEVLADMFYAITSIKVHLEENLPIGICGSCQNGLFYCFKFKEKCIESDNHLKLKTGTEKEVPCEKADKSIQTYFELNSNRTRLISTPTVAYDDLTSHKSHEKMELHLKREMDEVHQEIEYLDEELLLTNDTVNLLKEGNERQLVKFEGTDSDRLIRENIGKKKINKKNWRLSCHMCSKKFIKSKTLKAHIKLCIATNMKQFCCGQCNKSFNSENDLRIHSALHVKGNKWICNQCQKEFTDRNRFRRHIRRHMECVRLTCETCGKTFAELCALRRHVRVHTGERAEKRHRCEVCDKKFCDNTQLAEHMARHTGVLPHGCDVCGKSFASPRLLASHALVHTDQKSFACGYCDKWFRHESTRNTHHRTHTGEKPYVCATCGKSFIQNSNLKLHMRTHTGEKPYTCDVCGRKFASGSSLSSHRRTHTGEKPYSCKVCSKRFARTDLRTHMRLHTGERPFACSVCPKRFINSARLRDHYLLHTGEKPFQCAFCMEIFRKKSYLVKHIKTHGQGVKGKKRNSARSLPADDIVGKEIQSNIGHEVNKAIALVTEDIPLEVSGELILQDDSDLKAELVVVDNGQINYQNNAICLNGAVSYVNGDLNLNDINVVAVTENDVSTASVLEGTTVKLYHLDESLVQIETSGNQVTIRKITSKMTANF